MPQLGVYLSYPGTCEEALNFYASCFDGVIKNMQRFQDAPMPSDPSDGNRVMHAEFEANGIVFMASDSPSTSEIRPGNRVTLNVTHEDVDTQEKVFNAMAEGGKVSMPLQDTFWGARFGQLVDKYGISWMFNCEIKR